MIYLRRILAVFLVVSVLAPGAWAARKREPLSQQAPENNARTDGYHAEARLIQIYQTIGQAKTREALALADLLVTDHPTFQLAHLVRGDLLMAQTRPIRTMGDVPEATVRAAPGTLGELREESLLRIKALRERPPAGLVPAQFVRLSASTQHVIAIDASRSRLYVFQNTPNGAHLINDFYISIGKSGADKLLEGDLRTPLGVYFISSRLTPRTLKDFYGAGALPINYPNPYDVRRGRTGSGIWLHGTPSNQFSRAPKASDGCVVLANADLERILSSVKVRTTPVIVAPSLQWVKPQQPMADNKDFDDAWQQWLSAKASGDLKRTLGFYTTDFSSYGKSLQDWSGTLGQEMASVKGKGIEVKDLSILNWTDSAQTSTMVVTFAELNAGKSQGQTKRQYWLRSASATQNQWKIFFEGVIG